MYTSFPATPHPSAADLENLAREKLGAKKTQRILQHCKECPECAERLLDAVSSRPLESERLRLSKWNWISIGVLIVALLVLLGLLVWLLRDAARRQGAVEGPPLAAETVHREATGGWSEALFARAIVSPDGERMLRIDGLGVRLLDLRTGVELRDELRRDFSGVMAATFDGNGAPARYANRRRDLGWFVERDGLPTLTSLPPDALPAWAAGNADVAWTRPPGTRLNLGYPPEHRTYALPGRALGLAWDPAGEAAYALVMDDAGSAALVRARRAATRVEIVRDGLDASALPNGLAVAPDGEGIFVALASAETPDPQERHRPAADRDLDIFRIDARTGELEPVVVAPGDDFWPSVADGALYWTHNRHDASVVLLPLQSDAVAARPVAGAALDGVDAQMPAWHPEGGRLAFTRGGWRLADWGLPFDVVEMRLDADGRPAGAIAPLVTGYHQDLTPVWSPDGRWLAYSSRRASRPVPYYSGPDVADDIFLRPADSSAPERPLTRDGWEVGRPSWSPDGRRLVFDTWDRGGVPRVSRPRIITIDPRSGEVLGRDAVTLPAGVDGSVSVVWSPAGDELLLIERRDPVAQTLWLAPLGEAEANRLVDFESPTAAGADWLPGGDGVVYAASVDGRLQLFLAGRDGGTPRRLTDEPADLLHPRVSPDGRWIAATSLLQEKELRRAPLEEIRSGGDVNVPRR